MSDSSVGADYEFPFEVKSAGDSGLGYFARSDIEPGEVVPVDFTTILVPTDGDKQETSVQCDPNVWYENELVVSRWVGRVNRNIGPGEQLFISYIPNHVPTAQRQIKSKALDFTCGCDKCLERNDIYTAFLEDARDVANNAGVEWARSLSLFFDDIQAMEGQLVKQVNLLTQANQHNAADGDHDNSFQKELVFALWDLPWFHEHYYITSRRDGNKEKFVQLLERAIDNINQTALLAIRIWPRTHEVVILINRDITRWQNTWNHRNQAPIGING
ncbi:hypothetical protein F4782DRAFT_532189 [Xylaria castorea]|nr:hypothetical protein F4782DRAFT_532189 [Xylaria castorea]